MFDEQVYHSPNVVADLEGTKPQNRRNSGKPYENEKSRASAKVAKNRKLQLNYNPILKGGGSDYPSRSSSPRQEEERKQQQQQES